MLIFLFKLIIVTALVIFAISALIRILPWLTAILAALGLLIEFYLRGIQSNGWEAPPFGRAAA